jgi:hypothetical protein
MGISKFFWRLERTSVPMIDKNHLPVKSNSGVQATKISPKVVERQVTSTKS